MRHLVPIFLFLAACSPEDTETDTDTGTTSTPTNVTCGPLVTAADDLGRVEAWMQTPGYGVNHAFLYRVEAAGDGWVHAGTDDAVLTSLPREDWSLPTATPVWQAYRPPRLDGNDPLLFTAMDPLWIGYLPWVAAGSWVGVDGEPNDGSCPMPGDQDGWPTCEDTAQLDADHPYPLADGDWLLRLVFGFNLNETGNRIVSCYQTAFSMPDTE
jgi:hypothetical protein